MEEAIAKLKLLEIMVEEHKDDDQNKVEDKNLSDYDDDDYKW